MTSRSWSTNASILLALALQVPLVDAAVARVELHLEELLLLCRQVSGHLLLGPPFDQWLDPSPQPGQQLGVGLFLDGAGVVLAEPGRTREQARRRDRQQRPQLHEVVLHGGTGDRQLERSRQLACALVDPGLVILDELRLVEEQTR